MKYTSNYSLRKPDTTDIVDIADFNTNVDKIDTEIKKVNDLVSSTDTKIDTKVSEITSQLEQIENNKTDKSTTDNLQIQINNLVLGAVGDGNNAEVTQARGIYSTLNERLNNMISKFTNNETYLTDLNNAPINTVARYNSNVSNVPIKNSGGTVFTFAQTTDTLAQITITQTNKLYWRIKWGSTWTQWKDTFSTYVYGTENITDLNNLNVNTVARIDSNTTNAPVTIGGVAFSYGGGSDTIGQIYMSQIGDIYWRTKWGTSWSSWKKSEKPVFTLTESTKMNLNDLTMNSITRYDSDVENNPSTVGGTVFTFAKTTDTLAQIAINQKGVIYYRIKWGSTWTQWNCQTGTTFANISILKSIGVIGDSWASGVVTPLNGTNYTNYSTSWGQIIARDSGITCYNFSKGGETTKSWLSDVEYGLAKLQQTDRCPCYVIALGINDASEYLNGRLELGSESDIGTENATFYGYYSKIIDSIKNYSPNSKIILSTTPNNSNYQFIHINNAIIKLAEHYDIPVIVLHNNPLIDFEYIRSFSTTGHPTFIGHSYLARSYKLAIEKIMSENQEYFDDIGLYFNS